MSRLSSATIAAACGAVAACLYLAVSLGTSGGLILVYMTQLPLFLAGLWLGAGAAVIAGITSCVVLLAASDMLGTAIFAAFNVVPVILLVRQALLARPRGDGTLAWYPPGWLTAWAAALALTGIAGALLLFGGPKGLQASLQDVVGAVLDRLSFAPMAQRDRVAETLAMLIPGVVAASWMIISVINATLAQGVLVRFGANWRPSPHLTQLALPLWLPLALGVAAAGTVFAGDFRFIGVNMLIALSVPFGLAGLAVLHVAARRLPHPGLALFGFYTLGVLFGWPFLAVAVLGLLESCLGLRRRIAPQGVPIDG
jgi:hypothetical protein